MKKRVLENLKKVNPKTKTQQTYLDEAIDYIENTDEPTKRTVDVEWLQKRILEDIEKRKCDGLVFTKLNSYISEYEAKDET